MQVVLVKCPGKFVWHCAAFVFGHPPSKHKKLYRQYRERGDRRKCCGKGQSRNMCVCKMKSVGEASSRKTSLSECPCAQHCCAVPYHICPRDCGCCGHLNFAAAGPEEIHEHQGLVLHIILEYSALLLATGLGYFHCAVCLVAPYQMLQSLDEVQPPNSRTQMRSANERCV